MVKNNSKILAVALWLSVASFAADLVGLLRERVLTSTFGAGDLFDAFVAAFRLPDLIFNLVVLGALSAAFIPLFMDKLVQKDQGKDKAFDFARSLLNVIALGVIVLCAGYSVSAPYIVPLITPGFMGDKLSLTISLSRIMAWQPILLAISFVFSGMLNSFKRFIVYALAPILYNAGIIVGVLVLYPRLGPTGLAWGVVLGAALHLLVQLPSVLAIGWRWRPVLNWTSQEIRTVWRMMLPRVFGLAAQQINLLVVAFFGSRLLSGSISVFHLANNVQYIPIGVFGIAFAQAAFPTLAEQVARKQEKSFVKTLTDTFHYILFFVIPITVFFYLLRAQIIRVLFGAGLFDWQDTIMTYRTFGWLIMSIFAQSTIPLLTRAFYVRQDTKTPVIISFVSIVANVLLAILLTPRYGVEGLALAFSVSAIINFALLLGRLHWQLGGFNDREVISSLWRIALAAVVAGVVVQGLKYPVAWLVDMHRFWGVFTQIVVTGAGGFSTYIGLCWLFGLDDVRVLYRYVPRRWQPIAGTETPRFEGMSE